MRKIDRNPFPFAIWPNEQQFRKSKAIEFHDASADDLHHLDAAEQGKDPQHIPVLSPIGTPSSSGISPVWTIPEEHRAKWHELMAIENNRRMQQLSDLAEERKMHIKNGDTNFGQYARTFYNMARGERHRIAKIRNAYLDNQDKVDFKNFSKPTLLMQNGRPVDAVSMMPRQIIPAMYNGDKIDFGPKYQFSDWFIPGEAEGVYPERTTEPLKYGPVGSKYFLPVGHTEEEQPELAVSAVQSGQRPASARGQYSPELKRFLDELYKNQGQWAANQHSVSSSVLLNVPSVQDIQWDVDGRGQSIDLQIALDALANGQKNIDENTPRGFDIAMEKYQSPQEQLLLHQAWKHQRMSELTDENIPAMFAALHAASTYHEREFGKRRGHRLPAGVRDIEDLSPTSARENWTSRPADIHVQYPDLPPTIITEYLGKPERGYIKSGYVPIPDEMQEAYFSGAGTKPSSVDGSPVPDYSHWGPLAKQAHASDQQLFFDLSDRLLDDETKKIMQENEFNYGDDMQTIQPVNFDYRIQKLNPQTIAKFFRGMRTYNEYVLVSNAMARAEAQANDEPELENPGEQEKGSSPDEPYF